MAIVEHQLPRRSAARILPRMDAATRLLRRAAPILVVLGFWEIAPRYNLVEPTFLPPFSEVLRSGSELVSNGQLLTHVATSLSRSVSGLLLAILLAVPLGLAIGWYRGLADTLTPLIETFRNTAALSLLPVFILILGIGETSKVTLIVYSCSWPILLNTVAGVRGVDPLLIKAARAMGLSPLQRFFKVILPAALPTIFVGVRLAGAYSLLILVAAEMVGAKAGLGYLIIYSEFNFQIPQMYVGIITTTVIGLTFNQGLLALERHFTSWKPTAE